MARGFKAHPSSIHDHANRTGQRADQISQSGSSASGAGLHGQALGAIGSSTAGGHQQLTTRIQSAIGQAGSRLRNQSDLLHRTGTNISQTDDDHAGRIRGIHEPTSNVRNPHATGSSSRSRGSNSLTPRKPKVHFNPQTQEYRPNGSQSSGVLGEGRPSPRPSSSQLDPNSYEHPTGANSHSITGPPEPGNHPLKVGDSGLTTSSYMNAQDLTNHFDGQDGRPGAGKRPGMGSGLLIGDHVVPHSSMKYNTGLPNHHGVVDQVLTNAPQDLRQRPQHGKCAEVGAISDYLHNQDPNGTWTVDQAKHHFEQVGAATTAHRPGSGEPADACPSCQHLTSQLGISWYTRPITEADG